MNDNDRESQYFLEKSKLEGEIKSLQSKLESLESKRVQDNIIVARYEIAKVSSKWVLYTPRDREISRKTLKDLIDLFMDYREFHYEQGEAISIYDRDRKILHEGFPSAYKLLTETLVDRERIQARQKRYRITNNERIKEVKKHDPKILRPIHRDERTW